MSDGWLNFGQVIDFNMYIPKWEETDPRTQSQKKIIIKHNTIQTHVNTKINTQLQYNKF